MSGTGMKQDGGEGGGDGLGLDEDLAAGRCRVRLLWLPLIQVSFPSVSLSFHMHKTGARNCPSWGGGQGPVPAPGTCGHMVSSSGYCGIR